MFGSNPVRRVIREPGERSVVSARSFRSGNMPADDVDSWIANRTVQAAPRCLVNRAEKGGRKRGDL
jgi:hypothetical protein